MKHTDKITSIMLIFLFFFSCNSQNNQKDNSKKVSTALTEHQDKAVKANVKEKISELQSILTEDGIYWRSEGLYYTNEYKFFKDGRVYQINVPNRKRKGKYLIDTENLTIQTAWENSGSYLTKISNISENTISIEAKFSDGGGSGYVDVDDEIQKMKIIDDRFNNFR